MTSATLAGMVALATTFNNCKLNLQAESLKTFGVCSHPVMLIYQEPLCVTSVTSYLPACSTPEMLKSPKSVMTTLPLS